MAGKFVLSKAKNGKFHFSLKAGNGEIIATSQMYDTKGGCSQRDRVRQEERAKALRSTIRATSQPSKRP